MKTEKIGAIQISEDIDMDGMLAQLPIELRNKGAREAVKSATKVVSVAYKSRVPQGETGNLKRSITTKIVSYKDNTKWVGLAGARRPAGAHAHLIDQGHKINRRGSREDSAKGKNLIPRQGFHYVGGRFDLIAAIDTTKPAQDKAVTDSLVESIKKAGG